MSLQDRPVLITLNPSISPVRSDMAKDTTLFSRVDKALNMIRPALVMDGGNVELVDVTDDGIVTVKLVGACIGCPASTMTLKAGIEATLKEQVPEVTRVENVPF